MTKVTMSRDVKNFIEGLGDAQTVINEIVERSIRDGYFPALHSEFEPEKDLVQVTVNVSTPSYNKIARSRSVFCKDMSISRLLNFIVENGVYVDWGWNDDTYARNQILIGTAIRALKDVMTKIAEDKNLMKALETLEDMYE